MAHQDIAATLKVEMRYFLAGENAENVYYVKASGTIDEALLDAVGAMFISWEDTSGSTQRSNETNFYECVVTDMSSLFGLRKTYQPPAPIQGIIAEDSLPNNATIAVKENIGRRGKGVNGRKFWIGLAETQVTANNVLPATAASIVSVLDTLRDSAAALTGLEGLAVPHLVVAGVRPPLAQSDVITGFSIADTVIDSQKNRLPRHKRHKRP